VPTESPRKCKALRKATFNNLHAAFGFTSAAFDDFATSAKEASKWLDPAFGQPRLPGDRFAGFQGGQPLGLW
jgi:hypothetical protein